MSEFFAKFSFVSLFTLAICGSEFLFAYGVAYWFQPAIGGLLPVSLSEWMMAAVHFGILSVGVLFILGFWFFVLHLVLGAFH